MEAEFFKRTERAFMYNWQRASKDLKESIRLSAKSESDALKFNAKDWLKWFKSIGKYFRRTLGVRGVTLDWIYREEAFPKPQIPIVRCQTEGDTSPRRQPFQRGLEGRIRCGCLLDS
jgi:hypothetical protein